MHILSERDFLTVIQNKNPQFIYTTSAYPIVKYSSAEARIHLENTSSSDISKLMSRNRKSLLKPVNATSSKLSEEQNSLQHSSIGIFEHKQLQLLAKTNSKSAITSVSVYDSTATDLDENSEEDDDSTDDDAEASSSFAEVPTKITSKQSSGRNLLNVFSSNETQRLRSPSLLRTGSSFVSNFSRKFRETIRRPFGTIISKESLRQNQLMVDFENTVIHVPGCHGKSIIRFDFIPASNPE